MPKLILLPKYRAIFFKKSLCILWQMLSLLFFISFLPNSYHALSTFFFLQRPVVHFWRLLSSLAFAKAKERERDFAQPGCGILVEKILHVESSQKKKKAPYGFRSKNHFICGEKITFSLGLDLSQCGKSLFFPFLCRKCTQPISTREKRRRRFLFFSLFCVKTSACSGFPLSRNTKNGGKNLSLSGKGKKSFIRPFKKILQLFPGRGGYLFLPSEMDSFLCLSFFR